MEVSLFQTSRPGNQGNQVVFLDSPSEFRRFQKGKGKANPEIRSFGCRVWGEKLGVFVSNFGKKRENLDFLPQLFFWGGSN